MSKRAGLFRDYLTILSYPRLLASTGTGLCRTYKLDVCFPLRCNPFFFRRQIQAHGWSNLVGCAKAFKVEFFIVVFNGENVFL